MDTPSGGINTALDKFILKYMYQGYTWKFDNDNIIFSKNGSRLFAEAQYNDKHWICGYNIRKMVN